MGPKVLHGSCNCRKLKVEGCWFNKPAPDFSSLRNLESLTLVDLICDLTSLQDLDRLIQLTIHFGREHDRSNASPWYQCRCDASLALVCPRNLLQLEISNHSYSAHSRLPIDEVCCLVISRFVAVTRPA